jgi:hypothetical protein
MKSFLEKNTLKNSELQLIYNNLTDDKCESLLGTKNERQPQELSLKGTISEDQTPIGNTAGQNQELFFIEGLQDFSFVSPPQDELELKTQFDRFIEQMRVNEIQL